MREEEGISIRSAGQVTLGGSSDTRAFVSQGLSPPMVSHQPTPPPHSSSTIFSCLFQSQEEPSRAFDDIQMLKSSVRRVCVDWLNPTLEAGVKHPP